MIGVSFTAAIRNTCLRAAGLMLAVNHTFVVYVLDVSIGALVGALLWVVGGWTLDRRFRTRTTWSVIAVTSFVMGVAFSFATTSPVRKDSRRLATSGSPLRVSFRQGKGRRRENLRLSDGAGASACDPRGDRAGRWSRKSARAFLIPGVPASSDPSLPSPYQETKSEYQNPDH